MEGLNLSFFYDISVFGLMRTGNHAICSWIAGHFSTGVSFITDVKRYSKFESYLINPQMMSNRIYKEKWVNNSHLTKAPFIHDYQDYIPKKEEIESYKTEGKKFCVVILRDPFNLYASRLKMAQAGYATWPDCGIDFISCWKNLAKFFFKKEEMIGDAVLIPINYNQWFSSGNYRRDIEKKFGFEKSEAYLNSVAKTTDIGSSFDGNNFNGKAQEMPVLERWREFPNHPKFMSFLEDEEMTLFIKKLFPEILEAYNG